MSEDLHPDLHTQHEDPTGDAGRSVASHLTVALAAAQRTVDTAARRTTQRTDQHADDPAARSQEPARDPQPDRGLPTHTSPDHTTVGHPVPAAGAGDTAGTLVGRYAPVVRQVLEPGLAAAVVADPAWPRLAETLHTAAQTGTDPAGLLATAAAQRELATASRPAQVLAYRIDRHPTAADTAATGYPTPLTNTVQTGAQAGGTDRAGAAAAAELSRTADTETRTAQVAAATPDDVTTPSVDEHTDGLAAARVHDSHAAAELTRAGELAATSTSIGPAGPAAAVVTAARGYPLPVTSTTTGPATRPAAAPPPATRATAATTRAAAATGGRRVR